MPHRRQISNHGASGGSSTNIGEDWTQILDPTIRKRARNRIAQRTYRKKLRARLEDLQRRAGSSSAPSAEVHTQQPTGKQQTNKAYTTLSISTASCPELSPQGLARNRYTTPMHNDEDPLSSTDFDRDGSPPFFIYPSPKESTCLPYPTTQRSSLTSNDDSWNPLSTSYAVMAYGDFNPQAPPLSYSFEHSTTYSETDSQITVHRCQCSCGRLFED